MSGSLPQRIATFLHSQRKASSAKTFTIALNVVKIELPPLHERPEDIALLAEHFVQKFSRPGSPLPSKSLRRRWKPCYSIVGQVTFESLKTPWNGACVTSRDDIVRPENLPAEILKPIPAALSASSGSVAAAHGTARRIDGGF